MANGYWIVATCEHSLLRLYVFFTALLFAVFTLIALRAIVDWNKQYKQQDEIKKENNNCTK